MAGAGTSLVLLVIGVFSMFYIRERRLWVWIKDGADEAKGDRKSVV